MIAPPVCNGGQSNPWSTVQWFMGVGGHWSVFSQNDVFNASTVIANCNVNFPRIYIIKHNILKKNLFLIKKVNVMEKIINYKMLNDYFIKISRTYAGHTFPTTFGTSAKTHYDKLALASVS